jgi:hypothetical protein
MIDDKSKKAHRPTAKATARHTPAKSATAPREKRSYVLDEKISASAPSNAATEADSWTKF